jgi:hypothetical protein
MPISDDDLNYLRNINTRPGPNAGKSIDPTRPGPSDKTDKWDREHVKRRAIVQDEKGRFEAIDKAALAQSDAEPHRDLDDTKVICPNCTHQFRAISVMDQARLAQSDAFMGLIEAAEWHEAQASAWERPNSSSSSAWPAIIAREHRKFAEYFRARAADRGVYGEPIPDCPTDGVAARQGNGG